MKKLYEYKAGLLIIMAGICTVLALESNNALLSVAGIVVSGMAGGAGIYYWGYPRPQRYYWDAENQEYCYGYHLRDLIKDQLLRLWGRVRVPVQVAFTLAGLTALVLLCLHNWGLFL